MIDEAVEVRMAMKFPEAFLGFNMTGIEFLLDFKSRIENFLFPPAHVDPPNTKRSRKRFASQQSGNSFGMTNFDANNFTPRRKALILAADKWNFRHENKTRSAKKSAANFFILCLCGFFCCSRPVRPEKYAIKREK